MLGIAGIVAVATIIAFLEVPALRKKKDRRGLAVFVALLLIGLGLGIPNALHVWIPRPLGWITLVFKPFSDILLRIGLIK